MIQRCYNGVSTGTLRGRLRSLDGGPRVSMVLLAAVAAGGDGAGGDGADVDGAEEGAC